MKNIFRIFVIILLITAPSVSGCQKGPSQATEVEGEKGMDDMSKFDDAANVDKDTKPGS